MYRFLIFTETIQCDVGVFNNIYLFYVYNLQLLLLYTYGLRSI